MGNGTIRNYLKTHTQHTHTLKNNYSFSVQPNSLAELSIENGIKWCLVLSFPPLSFQGTEAVVVATEAQNQMTSFWIFKEVLMTED